MQQILKSNSLKIRNYFSRSTILAAAFIAILVLAIAVYIASCRKTVKIAVDNKVMSVVTYSSKVSDILQKNNIVIGAKDKVEPGLYTNVENGQEIYIKRAVNLDVLVDGKDLKIKSAESSVGSMLKAEKISMSDIDKVKPDKSSGIVSGMKVVITRVNTKTVTEVQPIAYDTIDQKDNTMGNDQSKVVQQGVNGSKQVTMNIVYEDGKEVSRNIVKETVTVNPVQAIMKVGTLGVLNVNRGGRVLYKSEVTALATAYTDSPSFGITATGTRTVRNPDGYSSVAVDPRVIPLGSKLYIPGYGYGIASDTGGAIKGDRVDLFFDSEEECYSWGAKNVDVYIIN